MMLVTSAPVTWQPMPAMRIGNYALISRIGSGGVGTVFLAEDGRDGQSVALKVLSPPNSVDVGEFLARFQREASVIASLDHPHIVRVRDAGIVDGQCFIAMPYLNYGTLKDRLTKFNASGERMPVVEVLDIARQIAQALDYAHKRGLIHRDVKPGNIMLAAGGRYVLADFGVVFMATGTRLTRDTGHIIGTAEYISPEQAEQQPFDHRADIYALGVVLYEMLTGTPPFTGDTDLLTLYAHAHRAPKPINEYRDDVPANVIALVECMLAKQPSERFGTAGELVLAIEQALGMLDSKPNAKVGPLQNRQAGAMLAAIALAVTLVIGIGFIVRTSSPTRNTPQRPTAVRIQLRSLTLTVITDTAVRRRPLEKSSLRYSKAGEQLSVHGRTADGTWLQIALTDTTQFGWINTHDGTLSGTLHSVPVVPMPK